MAESSGNGWKWLGCFYTTCFTKCKDVLQGPFLYLLIIGLLFCFFY